MFLLYLQSFEEELSIRRTEFTNVNDFTWSKNPVESIAVF